MRTFFALLLLIGPCTCVRAQSSPTDSLHRVIREGGRDSLVFEAYVQLLGGVMRQDTALAGRYLDTLRRLAAAAADPYFRGRYRYMEAQRSYARRDWAAARENALAAADHYADHPNPARRFDAHYLLGNINMRENRNEAAFEQYLIALRLGREYAARSGQRMPEASALEALGVAHKRVGNLAESAPYLEEAIVLYRELGRPRNEGNAVMNLAILRKNEGETDAALALYRRGLALAEAGPRPDSLGMGYVLVNLAELMNRTDRPAEALAYATRGAEILAVHGGAREQAAALLQTATAAGRLGRFAEAAAKYRRVARIGGDYPALRLQAYEGMKTSFRKLNLLDSVIVAQDTIAAVRAREAEKNRVGAVAEMEAKYQNGQKQAEVDRLRLEDEVKSLQLRRREWIIGGTLLLLGLLASFLYFLIQQRRRIRAQNATIGQSLAEKETLLREIHHRVKNNLQMVSSLLSLQSDYIDDPGALDAIQMGQRRVRSMAIIHQKLYLRDRVTTTVSAREYLEQLIRELMGALNVSGRPLELGVRLEDIELDIDRLIPLGLLANEVITNAMKYAFEGRDRGSLDIDFRRVGTAIELRIADDGPGLGSGLLDGDGSFGSLLIRTFTEQLDGELDVRSDPGTVITLRFPATAAA